MLRSARFAAAFASGDDPSEDERLPPPDGDAPADSDSTPGARIRRTILRVGEDDAVVRTSSGCCSSSKAMPCSRPRTARTR